MRTVTPPKIPPEMTPTFVVVFLLGTDVVGVVGVAGGSGDGVTRFGAADIPAAVRHEVSAPFVIVNVDDATLTSVPYASMTYRPASKLT